MTDLTDEDHLKYFRETYEELKTAYLFEHKIGEFLRKCLECQDKYIEKFKCFSYVFRYNIIGLSERVINELVTTYCLRSTPSYRQIAHMRGSSIEEVRNLIIQNKYLIDTVKKLNSILLNNPYVYRDTSYVITTRVNHLINK